MSHSSTAPPSRPSSPAPLYRRQAVRIACAQYDVKLGRVSENAAKVARMTRHLQPGSLDLLVLPEMCLSGYVFNHPTAILPYLEPQRIGPTSLLAQSLAQRLRCHVIAGYPEALPSAPQPPETDAERSQSESNAGPSSMKQLEGEGTGVGWNSAVVVAPSGEVVGNYRKTFRFETDKSWAKEGDGFSHFDLPEPLGRVAVGICMEMHDAAPWDAFELANYCRDNAVDMLVVPMNWLSPPEEPPEDTPEQDPNAPSESNLNYWAARLTPLHDPVPGYASARGQAADPIGGKEVIFVACNRIGSEEGTTFIGTSSVMTISSEPSRIELVECCNVSEERVLLATVG
uniref:Protein N-terminal amidase n=1 Tax=Kwoniella dejecticola CBS 10117 TaxID=1296121 RepID=A0A1A6AF00_9TREE|nr:protein N-terminal amidase [Kwoniella dejecticola CBS 10117]OBR88603.1 protein N-terminal amidase [Kwoniella dejecticola CBS 10117]